MDSLLNPVTATLAPYPMEELTLLGKALRQQGKTVYDFGTGDPTLPTWEPIRNELIKSVPTISQYPSVIGSETLRAAHYAYLKRRFNLSLGEEELYIVPAQGSKEAIFHIALCLVGRAGGRRKILYPDPGYPVYRTSALFAGGLPSPVTLKAEDNYLLCPWKLPRAQTQGAAAIWVNYPHNPTGAIADESYWRQLIAWCHQEDVILLADDCYVDLYSPLLDGVGAAGSPQTPLVYSRDRVLSFMSLSKRSGMTGYRAGFIAGDPRILKGFARARANFGLGQPSFIQAAAAVAWSDDAHVEARKKIFAERMQLAGKALQQWGLLDAIPQATFYLWCRVPKSARGDDLAFCRTLAHKGIVASPSSWLSEGIKGYFRLALVPSDEQIREALPILGGCL
jgi:succinyldiaminopimelate transaminase